MPFPAHTASKSTQQLIPHPTIFSHTQPEPFHRSFGGMKVVIILERSEGSPYFAFVFVS
jgi:hypothetical protein